MKQRLTWQNVWMAFSAISCVMFVVGICAILSTVANALEIRTITERAVELTDGISLQQAEELLDTMPKILSPQMTSVEFDGFSNTCSVFEDLAQNLYVYDEDKLVLFSANTSYDEKNTVLNSCTLMSNEQISRNAYQFLQRLVDNADEYTQKELKFDEQSNTFSVAYVYTINDISTTDVVYLIFSADGRLVFFSIPRNKAFKNMDITSEHVNKARECVMSQLETTYGDDLQNKAIVSVVLGEADSCNVFFVNAEFSIYVDDELIDMFEVFEVPFE